MDAASIPVQDPPASLSAGDFLEFICGAFGPIVWLCSAYLGEAGSSSCALFMKSAK